jgi:hypothetical protein
MATTLCQLDSICARNARTLYYNATASLLLTSCAGLEAAPITMRFDAVVGPPRQGTFPIELPFSFAEGDRITGSMTFEPLDVPSEIAQTNVIQVLPFRCHIATVTLESPAYQIRVEDNVVSDDGPIPGDEILVQCLGRGTPCITNPIQNAPQAEWSFSWMFRSDEQVLHGADIPENLETWNRFLPSTLLVSFQDRTTGRGAGFQATVNTFKTIPEPSTWNLIVFAVLCYPFVIRCVFPSAFQIR